MTNLSASSISSDQPLTPLLVELLKLEQEYKRRLETRKLLLYRAYTKQKTFHAAGAAHRERLFMAGNQCLTPDTVIQTEFGERRIVDMIGVPSFGVRSWADGSR